ncbi:MAG: hypothetical protein EBU46_10855 [Nitrosomonadaceae bacterium]|nr:hypothetical protein [Nitrosomonadaceae bacterium]
MTAKECALKYLSLGLSVIAIAPNGSKGPAREVGSWLPYMNTARATEAQVDAWWPEGSRNGVAIVGGILSDDLAVIDIETGDAYTQFRADCQQEGLLYALDACPIVITPNGGRHIYCFGVKRKNLKLAKSTEGKTLIEIKGSNGYVLAPGSTEECHPTGLLYRWENNSLLELPAPALHVDKDNFDVMVAIATIQNVGKFPEKPLPIPTPSVISDGRKRPGDDYNERADWETLLKGAGWDISRIGRETIYWRRPGKDEGISGTTGHCKTDTSGDKLYVFSTNAAPFQAQQSYSKFAAYTMLKHEGNFYAATRALAAEGYGEPEVEVNFLHKPKASAETTTFEATPDPVTGRRFKWGREIKAANYNGIWHWHGYVRPGCVTMLSALWKAGKTTLISQLLRAWETQESFLGQKIAKTRALYISEENDSTWEPRCNNYGLNVNDHHGWIMQPFSGTPSMAQWQAFLADCKADMVEHGFDCLVVDTLSSVWPVKDENSASEVGAAFQALKYFAKDGKHSVLVVHHMRKSQGADFTAARGSGAGSASADLLMEFFREEAGFGQRSKTKRVIKGSGRFNEVTPEEMIIDFIDGELVCLGQKDELEFETRKLSIIEVLSDFEYMTLEQVQAASGQRRDTVIKQLEDLVRGGEVETTGAGTRGSKKKFRKVSVLQPLQKNLGDFNNGNGQSL